MPSRGPESIFDEAIEMLREADRMHRQFFRYAIGPAASCWEPPVDIVENDRALVIRVALPGVRKDAIEVRTDGTSLHVAGTRALAAGPGETIHRLEIPQGRFERRIELPSGRFELREHDVVDGCLVLLLRRLA